MHNDGIVYLEENVKNVNEITVMDRVENILKSSFILVKHKTSQQKVRDLSKNHITSSLTLSKMVHIFENNH